MPHTVLVVDDSATMRQQTKTLLTSLGYAVVEAVNGSDGLERAKATKFDAMIVDVNMPVMGGIEMITKVRQLPPHQKTPIFVLTTESSPETVQQGRAAGATAWVVKPFKPEVMTAALKQVLK